MGAARDKDASGSTSKGAQKHVVADAIPIMETNSSSIISKRSVEHKFYPQPHFLRYFVKKRKTRSPLIHRGYWLRMRCIESTIMSFCGKATKPVIVLNLGAGFDALPFRLLSLHPELFSSTTFIDVDYEELIQTKVRTILAESELVQLLGSIDNVATEGPWQLVSDKYQAFACDLHDITALKAVVCERFGKDHSILMVSEVATCYMEYQMMDELLEWAATLEDEQHLPCGPKHPFAEKMLEHFVKVKSPLRGINQYPTIDHQMRRFSSLGWYEVNAKSLWNIWNSEDMVFQSHREQLDRAEPFDEWEEFALFACHYFVLVAKSEDAPLLPEFPGETRKDLRAVRTATTGSIDLKSASAIPQRRFGSLYCCDNRNMAYHGGYGPSRLNSTVLLRDQDNSIDKDVAGPPSITPRVCHTLTQLGNGSDLLLSGGRASPDHIFADCWLRRRGVWRQSDPLPIPLYRHCSIAVKTNTGSQVVLVYGGRTVAGHASNRCFVWQTERSLAETSEIPPTDEKWCEVSVRAHSAAEGRFSALMASIDGRCEGLLMGGLEENGVMRTEQVLTWKLIQESQRWCIEFEPIDLEAIAGYNLNTSLNRFGAVLVPCTNKYMVIGGIGHQGLCTQPEQTLALESRNDASGASRNPRSNQTVQYRVDDLKVKDSPHLLIGHSAIWDGEKVCIIGGGAVCFAFGTHYNRNGLFVREDGEAGGLVFPIIKETVGSEESASTSGGVQSQPQIMTGADRIGSITKTSEFTFTKLLEDLSPVVLCNLDFGACIRKWTPAYLVSTIGADRQIIIHRTERAHLSYLPGTRNFEYVESTFGSFIEAISKGGQEYFRALSQKSIKNPANLSEDFPEIAADFTLPESLMPIAERLHSSVLRISGPVSMWLHYDVQANILVQIQGAKTLMLFPPSDVEHLDIPPGSSSSKLDVSKLLSRESAVFKNTHPREVTLSPGDALFIPPLWLHCAIPNEGVSIAVNVFFRNLDEGYAAGRDAYGNRDVQAYEEGRRDVAKMVNRFRTLPRPMADFYLKRLQQEVAELGNEIAANAPRHL